MQTMTFIMINIISMIFGIILGVLMERIRIKLIYRKLKANCENLEYRLSKLENKLELRKRG